MDDGGLHDHQNPDAAGWDVLLIGIRQRRTRFEEFIVAVRQGEEYLDDGSWKNLTIVITTCSRPIPHATCPFTAAHSDSTIIASHFTVSPSKKCDQIVTRRSLQPHPTPPTTPLTLPELVAFR